MKVLFLSRWYPYPPDNGSKLRIYHLLRELARAHTVDLISFTSEPVDLQKTSPLHGICRHIQTSVYSPMTPGGLAGLAGLFAPRPRSVVATYSAELDALAQSASNQEQYDLVIASQIDMAPYAAKLNIAARLFEEIELTTIWEQYALARNPFKRMRGLLTWLKLRRYVHELLKSFQATTVVSDAERQRVLRVAPRGSEVVVIPNGVDSDWMAGDFGEPQADTLVYNGALTYQANFDAVAYFLAEIFPRIQAGRPGTKLYITGKTDGVRLQRLPQNDGVVFTGYMQDVRPRVAQSWVNVVPLRIGGGTRLKILESLALGTPVVSTSKGAEGLHLRAGEDYLRADTPATFADATLRLLNDPEMRARLAETGRNKVRELYDWRMIGHELDTLARRVAASAAESPSLAAVERPAR